MTLASADHITADPADPAWHAARRTFIGASDAAAVLGLSPWATALDVWADPTRIRDTLGRIYDQADGAPCRLSHAGLDLIADIKRSKALLKDLKAQIEAAENELRSELGDSTEGYADDNAKPVVTWRSQDKHTFPPAAIFAGTVDGFTEAELSTAARALLAVEKITTSRVLRVG